MVKSVMKMRTKAVNALLNMQKTSWRVLEPEIFRLSK